jgi:hypothetical protein
MILLRIQVSLKKFWHVFCIFVLFFFRYRVIVNDSFKIQNELPDFDLFDHFDILTFGNLAIRTTHEDERREQEKSGIASLFQCVVPSSSILCGEVSLFPILDGKITKLHSGIL